MNLINAILHSKYVTVAVYAGTGYLVQHGITDGHVWLSALVAAGMALVGLIHSNTAPPTP